MNHYITEAAKGNVKIISLLLMGLFFTMNFFITNQSIAAEPEDLSVYREKVLNHLVLERTGRAPARVISFKKLSLSYLLFRGGFLTFFQADNVDRSWAVFQLKDESKKTKCGLYIREVPEEKTLAANLMECTGPFSRELNTARSGLAIPQDTFEH